MKERNSRLESVVSSDNAVCTRADGPRGVLRLSPTTWRAGLKGGR
jgi:hypothetical protein